MTATAPDFAQVRRHFYANTIDTQILSLPANTVNGFAYAQDQCGDAVMVRMGGGAGVSFQVQSFGVSGDVAERYSCLVSTVPWSTARRITVSPAGGGIDVRVRNSSGVLVNNNIFQVERFIGVNARELGPFHECREERDVFVPAGTFSPIEFDIPTAGFFDRVAVWAVARTSTGTLYLLYHGDSNQGSTAGSDAFPMNFGPGVGQVFATDLPTNASGMSVQIFNSGGVLGNFSYGYRVYRAGG